MSAPEEQSTQLEATTGTNSVDLVGLLCALALGSWNLLKTNYWEAAFSFTLVILAFVMSRMRTSSRASQLHRLLTVCLWVLVAACFFQGWRH